MRIETTLMNHICAIVGKSVNVQDHIAKLKVGMFAITAKVWMAIPQPCFFVRRPKYVKRKTTGTSICMNHSFNEQFNRFLQVLEQN